MSRDTEFLAYPSHGCRVISTVFTATALLGAGLVFFGVNKYLWDRRRGGSNSQSLMWSLLCGMVLSGPGLIIPVILKMSDAIIGMVASIMDDGQGSSSSNLSNGWNKFVHQADSSSSSTPTATHPASHPSATTSAKPAVTEHSSHFDSGLFLTIAAIIGLIILTMAGVAVTGYIARKESARRKRYALLMQRVNRAHEIGKAAEDRWLTYDKDMAALLRAPAMRMWSDEKTAACIDAMSAYDKIKLMVPSRGDEPDQAETMVSNIENAAAQFEKALDAAERNAKGLALSTMPEEERNALRRAQAALNIALDPAATESERERALHVVRSTLDRLDITPKETLMAQIEQATRQQIEAPKAAVLA